MMVLNASVECDVVRSLLRVVIIVRALYLVGSRPFKCTVKKFNMTRHVEHRHTTGEKKMCGLSSVMGEL